MKFIIFTYSEWNNTQYNCNGKEVISNFEGHVLSICYTYLYIIGNVKFSREIGKFVSIRMLSLKTPVPWGIPQATLLQHIKNHIFFSPSLFVYVSHTTLSYWYKEIFLCPWNISVRSNLQWKNVNHQLKIMIYDIACTLFLLRFPIFKNNIMNSILQNNGTYSNIEYIVKVNEME